ncbi:MAG TPA: hypothetical protein VH878_03205, partial [Thermodesulfobacteriota bacterium]
MNPYSFSCFDCVLGTIYIINMHKGISAIIFGKNRFKEFITSLNEVKLIQGGEAEKSIREIRLYI